MKQSTEIKITYQKAAYVEIENLAILQSLKDECCHWGDSNNGFCTTVEDLKDISIETEDEEVRLLAHNILYKLEDETGDIIIYCEK